MDQPIDVLWVEDSYGDLRTSTRENFSSLYQRKLLDLKKPYAARSDKGLRVRRMLLRGKLRVVGGRPSARRKGNCGAEFHEEVGREQEADQNR